MTSESNIEPAQGVDTSRPKDFFNRLAGVYFSPQETFREIVRSPGVLVPIIALIVIGVLVGFYLSRNLDMDSVVAARLQQAVAQGRMTQEQADQQAAVISKFANLQFLVGIPVANIVVVIVIAAGFKLISSLIGADNRYRALFAVTLYALLAVSIIQSGLTVLVIHLKGPGEIDAANPSSMVASNLGVLLAALLGDDVLPKFFMRLAGFVDLFAIWLIALLAIGYAAVSRKLKTSRAALWLVSVYAVIAVIIAAISSSFGN